MHCTATYRTVLVMRSLACSAGKVRCHQIKGRQKINRGRDADRRSEGLRLLRVENVCAVWMKRKTSTATDADDPRDD